MKLTTILSSLFLFFTITVTAQSFDECISILETRGISLDITDKTWLEDNSSFLKDMTSLAKMDTTSMNRAIIEMSTKLLSNELTEITDEEAKGKKELITEIIHGALDRQGLKEEKLLSAMSWYNMIVKEIKI